MHHEDAIRLHAREDAPNEACGLIVREEGEIRAVRCKNTTAEDPREHFRIDPSEYVQALRAGTLLGFYHTHPDGDAEASRADRATLNSTRMPMWIHGGATDEIRCHIPEGAVRPLIGRDFVPLFQDCVNLAWDVASLCGIHLPHLRRDGRSLHLGAAADWREWMPAVSAQFTDKPQPGDLLLMNIRGAKMPNHLGILLSDDRMLHQTSGEKSQKDLWGGYWKKQTMRCIRIPAIAKRAEELDNGTLDFHQH